MESVRNREFQTREKLSELTHKYEMLKIEHCKKLEDLEKQLEDSKEKSSIEEEKDRTEIVELKRKIEQMEIVLEAAQQDADAHRQLAEELSNLFQLKKKKKFKNALFFRKSFIRKKSC